MNIVATYDYCDETGNLLYQVYRLDPKSFRQRCSDGSWSLDGVRKVPYRLPDLIAAKRNGYAPRVYIVEGEKDADRLREQWGMLATTNSGGASSRWPDEFNQFFVGFDVVIIPDNDELGRKHADDIAVNLAPIAESVRVLELPRLPEKGDVSDWLDRNPDATQSDFEGLVEQAEPFRTQPNKQSARRILTGVEFVASTRAPDWVVDGIVQRGRLYSCTSLTGHGKTAVWLYNACMIQAARKIGHLETEPGNSLILAGENPEDLQLRMLGMARAFNLDPKQLPYVLPATFPMTDDEADSLRAEIDALGEPFMMIIGDTTASFFPGEDENDNVQSGRYGRTLRTLTQCHGNPAIISLSHPVKNASRDNLLPRGGGAFLNELDGNLTLWSSQIGEATTLHWQGKIRGPDFDPFTYRLKPAETGLRDRKGRDVLTVIADPLDDFEAANQTAQKIANEDAALKILHDHPRWSQSEVATALGWFDKNNKPEKYKVGRCFRALHKLGLADTPRGRWEVTDKGKKALNKHSEERS